MADLFSMGDILGLGGYPSPTTGLGGLQEMAAGRPLGWGDAFSANRNALVGMGLGMLGGGWAGGMKGYESGAGLDEQAAARMLQARQQAAQLDLQRAQLNRPPEQARMLQYLTGQGIPQSEALSMLYPKTE